jgi:20S proteasome alpha/beta subunit
LWLVLLCFCVLTDLLSLRAQTTFDPSGRLLMVEYSQSAAARGATLAAAACRGRHGVLVVVAVAVRPASKRSSILSTPKVHRIDDSAWLFTAGLAGDSRSWAAALRRAAQEHRRSCGEPMTAEQVARRAAELQHERTRVAGVRPLGCVGLVVGGNEPASSTSSSDPPLRLFRVSPGGSMEDCLYAAAGKGAASVMKTLADRYGRELREANAAEAVKRLVQVVQDATENKEACMDVWCFQPGEAATCFTSVGTDETMKRVASHFATDQPKES